MSGPPKWHTKECIHGVDLRLHPRCYFCKPEREKGLDVERMARAVHDAVDRVPGVPTGKRSLTHSAIDHAFRAYREDSDVPA